MALHWPDALYADCGAVPGDQQKDSLYRFLFLDGGAGPLSDALACFSGVQPHCESVLLYQGNLSGREAFCKDAKGAEYYYEGSDPSHIRILCLELLYGIYHDGCAGSISGNADSMQIPRLSLVIGFTLVFFQALASGGLMLLPSEEEEEGV